MNKKIVLALSAAALCSTIVQADDASDIAELKKLVAELQANQEALVDETSNAQVGFTTVDTSFSHNGMGAAASKVYKSSSPLSIGGYGDMYFESSDKKGADNIADVYHFVPYIGYKFTDSIILNTELEFEHGGANPEMDEPEGYAIVEFMYLDFLMQQAFNVQLGHLLVPMGLINMRHEPTLYNTVQKPKTEKYIIPSTWHSTGALAYGTLGESGISYNAGVIQAINLDNEFAGTAYQIYEAPAGSTGKTAYNKAALVGRLDYRGINGLLLGASVYYGDATQGSISGADALIYDLHATYEIAGFKAKALYSAAHIENADKIAAGQSNPLSANYDPLNQNGLSMQDANGYYINLEYDVLAQAGTSYRLPLFVQYDAIDPTQNVVDKNGDAVAGYDYIDDTTGLVKTASTNTKEATTTVGLNFFPHEQVVLKMDYAMTDIDAGKDYNTFSMGLGFIF
ncbi:hypothetical protein [Sulfurimonas sp. HSL3-7]|uniref:hypothetical protein n=1 Tax=Sulfonitrofixus jiaomeiensis TaxID=3131938 RepID=UPI0031F95F79